MRPRIEQELALLREHYPDIVHLEHGGEDWFLIPRYLFPPGWARNSCPVTVGPVVFKVGSGHPSSEPYGFATAAGVVINGAVPNNTTLLAAPFPGAWLLFSWQPAGDWRPNEDVRTGSNLYGWARSFRYRLAEGA